MQRDPGDSAAQRSAEAVALRLLSERLDVAAVLKAAGLEIVVVELPESVRAEVAVAQELQYR